MMLYWVRHSHNHYICFTSRSRASWYDWGLGGLHGQVSWLRVSSIPTPSETMMLYPALWVRINGIHNFLNCSPVWFIYDSQAQVEHHSITGDWKVFFLAGNKSSEDTCMLISVYGHFFTDYKKTESFIAAKSFPLAPATI